MNDNIISTETATDDVASLPMPSLSGEVAAAGTSSSPASAGAAPPATTRPSSPSHASPALAPTPFGTGAARRAARRASGTGVMSARLRENALPAERQAITSAANEARSTGKRFDLMRYLRLRRKR